MPDQPLVVQGHRLEPAEPLRAGTDAGSRSTTGLWNRIIATCVWATIRFSSLRGSRITALRSPGGPLPRQVVSDLLASLLRRSVADPEVQPVALVELRGLGVGRPDAVQASRSSRGDRAWTSSPG